MKAFRIDLYSNDFLLKEHTNYINDKVSGSYKIYIRLILENFYQSESDIIFLKKISLDRYNHRTIRLKKLKRTAYLLEELGYINVLKNYKFEKYKFSFCIKKTDKIDSLISQYQFKSQIDPWREVIELRSFDKKLKNYQDNKETILMRENLNKINKFLYFQKIKFQKKEINPFLKRVFNQSFKKGGRFYGDHQRLRSRERKHILINNETTVEVDFKGISIKLLYLKENINYTEDPYLIKGYEKNRNLFKIALQIVLNAKSKKSALYAIKNQLKGEKITPLQLIDLFEKKHIKISKYFYSQIGLELQKQDSIICEKVLLESLRKKVVVLPVHDSFIVQKKYKDYIIKLMKKVTKNLYNVEFDVTF